MVTLKPVMGEPPLSGSDQFIVTISGDCDHCVVGAEGWAGSWAAKIETTFDKALNPYWFLACTLNWYVDP